MRIQPKEHYVVFWGVLEHKQPEQCPGNWRRRLADYLGFAPGDYAFTVEGIVYVQPKGEPEPIGHTYRETSTLHVGISQVATAIAAFFGALLAYFVVSLQSGQDLARWKSEPTTSNRLKASAIFLRNAFSAGLLGSTVTIVASRLSDTQFPVKVSVNDFWGALTIGFFSYFIGTKFITTVATRFLASLGPAPMTPTPNPTPTPSPATSASVPEPTPEQSPAPKPNETALAPEPLSTAAAVNRLSTEAISSTPDAPPSTLAVKRDGGIFDAFLKILRKMISKKERGGPAIPA